MSQVRYWVLCCAVAIALSAGADEGKGKQGAVLVPRIKATVGIPKGEVDEVVALCQSEYDRLDCKKRDLFDPEIPEREVTVGPFKIDRYEVTNAQYKACVSAGDCTASSQSKCRIYDPVADNWKGKSLDADMLKPNAPVVCVDWTQAQSYCAWGGGRLPTEDEWEVAARGTDMRRFPWGNSWDTSLANWGDFINIGRESDELALGGFDEYSATAPVGSFNNASPFGAYDMAGNVWEWTASDFPGAKPDKEGNPQKVYRGGGFLSNPAYIRTSFRDYAGPSYSASHLGFRCVYEP